MKLSINHVFYKRPYVSTGVMMLYSDEKSGLAVASLRIIALQWKTDHKSALTSYCWKQLCNREVCSIRLYSWRTCLLVYDKSGRSKHFWLCAMAVKP